VTPRLDQEEEAALATASAAKRAASKAVRTAGAANRDAAAALRGTHPASDVAYLMGITPQRVSRLLRST
jgi:hypothetical protein